MKKKTVFDLRRIAEKQYMDWQRRVFIKALLSAMKKGKKCASRS